MTDYAKMYRQLFRAATKTLEFLRQAQIKAAEMHDPPGSRCFSS